MRVDPRIVCGPPWGFEICWNVRKYPEGILGVIWGLTWGTGEAHPELQWQMQFDGWVALANVMRRPSTEDLSSAVVTETIHNDPWPPTDGTYRIASFRSDACSSEKASFRYIPKGGLLGTYRKGGFLVCTDWCGHRHLCEDIVDSGRCHNPSLSAHTMSFLRARTLQTVKVRFDQWAARART